MTARLLALFALLALAGFLIILAWKLARLDLWVLVVVTLALAAIDFARNRP